MKKRVYSLLVCAAVVLVLAGCRTGSSVEATGGVVSTRPGTAALTREDAQRIALEHAGLTADRVTALHTEYEIDEGVPRYDVDFRYEKWEYDYEIDANSGEILSYSKDN